MKTKLKSRTYILYSIDLGGYIKEPELHLEGEYPN